ncbi:hypothetical protein [Asaia prunellae]|uniref:hypothetical protein n=1 Tax=Asaia prunellae TaxID=610245 RepID=UPI000470F2FD|nr:hypothetical protein [Asaia prunellae]
MFLVRMACWPICLVIAAIGLARPFFTPHVGLFFYPDQRWAFGIIRDTQGSSELLGVFFIPVCLGLATLLMLPLDRDPTSP